MSCCGPSRRTVLGALGLAALLPTTEFGTGRAVAKSGAVSATDLEVVTVTDTAAVLTWTGWPIMTRRRSRSKLSSSIHSRLRSATVNNWSDELATSPSVACFSTMTPANGAAIVN